MIERAAVKGQLSVAINPSFGHEIARLRLHAGITQKGLAAGLGLTDWSIMLVEQGKRRIALDRVPLLAQILGVDPQALTMKALAEQHPIVYAVLFEDEVAFKVHGSVALSKPGSPEERKLYTKFQKTLVKRRLKTATASAQE